MRESFRYILLDCPPSLGPLTVCALVAADRVIVPVQTEYFALEGLAGLLETLALVQRELNPRLTVAGMLLTMHDGRTRLGQDVEREVRAHFPDLVFDTVIPRNVRVGRGSELRPAGDPSRSRTAPARRRTSSWPRRWRRVAKPRPGMGRGLSAILSVSAEGDQAGRGGAARAADRADLAQPQAAAPALRPGVAGGAGRLAGRARRAAAGARAPEARGRYELVAGERRWRAAQHRRPASIPAIVREREDAQALEVGAGREHGARGPQPDRGGARVRGAGGGARSHARGGGAAGRAQPRGGQQPRAPARPARRGDRAAAARARSARATAARCCSPKTTRDAPQPGARRPPRRAGRCG